MKNILLLSSLYPSDDIHFKNNTSVCHYFAKDWVRMGYHVRVINLYNEYPLLFYPILKIAKNILAEKISTAILSERKHEDHTYEMDGIKITRIPVYKSKPHGDFTSKVIHSVADKIYKITSDEGFNPDYILGHFLLPSIHIIALLKDKYPNAITAVSLHGKEAFVRDTVLTSLHKIDYMGYRCFPIKDRFEALYGERPYFMCMSGVPENYIVDKERTFVNGVKDYIYVGNFMSRKYPVALIPAIANNYEKTNEYTITYVGDGNGRKKILKEAQRKKITDHIVFTGRIAREDVTKRMDASDVFIMISEAETFGLVWLEAMARGCITVASRDEGMDGIIIDGENGFLCNAGDSEELEKIVARIKSMDLGSLGEMSRKAIQTARNMTDRKMAETYLNGIEIGNR